MEATGSNEIAQIDVKQVECVVENAVESVVATEAVEVATIIEQVEQVEQKVEQVKKEVEQVQAQVEQVQTQIEDITKLVEQVYTNLKAQFDGQTSLPVCVLKVMTEVEKLIPKQQKKQVAVAVIQKLLPNVDAQGVVELIDAFIVVAKAPGAVQGNNQTKGCCICM